MPKPLVRRIGFTLIEVMVVMAIVAILVGIVIFIINPQEILKKARDAIRKDDLSKIAQVLGRYSLEQSGYPLSTDDYQIQGAPWGSPWQPYMVKVPQDPLPTQTYQYKSDGKYYQLYAKLENPDSSGCSPCGPGGEYNYGITSGSSVALAALPPAPTPTPTPTPTPSPSPIPTPIARVSGGIQVFISTQNQPQMMQLDINPFDPEIGATQSLSLSIRDTTGSPITTVTAIVRTDKGQNTYPLTLSTGTNINGVWTGSWGVLDSHEQIYNMTFTATNQNGSTSTADVQLEGSLRNLRSKL